MSIIPIILYNSGKCVQSTEDSPQGIYCDCTAYAQKVRWSDCIR